MKGFRYKNISLSALVKGLALLILNATGYHLLFVNENLWLCDSIEEVAEQKQQQQSFVSCNTATEFFSPTSTR